MNYLEFLYSGKGNVSHMYDVYKAFYHIKKNVKSLTAHFMEFKKTYGEFNIFFLFSIDIKVQQILREQMARMNFLTGHLNFKLSNLKFNLVPRSHFFKKFSVGYYAQRILHPVSILMFLLSKNEEKIITREETDR